MSETGQSENAADSKTRLRPSLRSDLNTTTTTKHWLGQTWQPTRIQQYVECVFGAQSELLDLASDSWMFFKQDIVMEKSVMWLK